MRLVIALGVVALLGGCANREDSGDWWRFPVVFGSAQAGPHERDREIQEEKTANSPLRVATVPGQKIPAGPRTATSLEDMCKFTRSFGYPVLVDKKLYAEMKGAMGDSKSSSLLHPLARANNNFRCQCGTPEERKIAKCK